MKRLPITFFLLLVTFFNVLPQSYKFALTNSLKIDDSSFSSQDSVQFIDYSYLKGKKFPKKKAVIIWKKNIEDEIPNDILISKNNLYVISRNGRIYCLDLTGKIVWTHQLDGNVVGKPNLINKVFVTATTDGDLLTIMASNGEVIQSMGIDDELTTDILKTKINYYGEETDALIVGGSSGTFYCYTLNKLELVWSNVFSDSEIVTKPLSVKHRIIFGSGDGYIYSIDDRTGVLYWKWRPKKVKKTIVDFSNPVSDGKNVYVTTSNGNIFKIDLLLGTTLLKIRRKKLNLSLGLSSTGRTVIAKNKNNRINLFYSKTGKIYKDIKLNLGKDSIKHKPFEWKRNFLVTSDKGTLYLIDKKYRSKPLYFLGKTPLHSVQRVNDNIFIVSNVYGMIVLFSLE